MKAMLLAAGKGERMRPLTEHTPKPLLKIGEHSLIEHHLYRLSKCGITDIIINIAYKSEMIRKALGNGKKYNLKITYSDEGKEPLETAGGIINALPLLGEEPFLVINSDIWTDFDFSRLKLAHDKLASLVMVNNPEHNPNGDFVLDNGMLHREGKPKLTFSGISIFKGSEPFNSFGHNSLSKGSDPLKIKLLDILLPAMQQNLITGEYYQGIWEDVGTPEKLKQLNSNL